MGRMMAKEQLGVPWAQDEAPLTIITLADAGVAMVAGMDINPFSTTNHLSPMHLNPSLLAMVPDSPLGPTIALGCLI
jgi:hypothetical protein